MKKYIKLLTGLLALILAVSLCACGETETLKKVELPTDVPSASELVSDKLIDPYTEWGVYDELIAKIKSESDMELRSQYIKEAEEVLMSGYWIVPLYNYAKSVLLSDDVEHFYFTPTTMLEFSCVQLKSGKTTFRFGGYEDVAAMDPCDAIHYKSLVSSALCFRGLLQYSEEGEIVCDLADNIQVSDDGLTYTVTIKEDAVWSDGVPITSQDFAYSWQRMIDPKTGAVYEYLFNDFIGYDENKLKIDILDDKTFKFYIRTACPYMDQLLCFNPTYPVRQDQVESAENWETVPSAWAQSAGFVCSGPYKVTDWVHNEYIVYEKNDLYWNSGISNVRKIEQMITKEPIAAYSAYSSGDLDCTVSVPTAIMGNLVKNNDSELEIKNSLGTCYLAFPINSDFLSDKTLEEATCIRKALALLIDRVYLCNVVLQDGSNPISTYIPIGMEDGNGTVIYEDNQGGYFDAEGISKNAEATLNEVRTLLMAAGYKFNEDGKLSEETPLYVPLTNYKDTSLFETIQQDFAVIGIKSTISSQDYSLFYTLRDEGSVRVLKSGWIADYNDPVNMLEVFTTGNNANDGKFGT